MASVQLELRDVSVVFQDNPLLNHLQLQVIEGESLVLVGPSGQGKTVVLKLLAGLLAPTSGQVLVEDQDLHALSFSKRTKLLLKMGMLFQKNALFDSLSVRENVAFPLREKTKLTEAEIQDRVEHFLEEVGIATERDLFPHEISGGQQKRLGIARALALNPQIVLYDDPTAGLDPITSRRIVDLILKLRDERRATIVTVTNDMMRAYQLATRIAMIVDGELLVTGDRAATLANSDPRVAQFVRGRLSGPLTET